MQIDKAINLPLEIPPVSKYPFNKMEIGDSVLIPGNMDTKKVYSAARCHAQRAGKKFCSRIEIDSEGLKGLRVWRVK
jgi:hypothetical protein